MTITKLGHCCLLIEDQGKVIMTDPGAWSTAQNEVKGVDIVLITHEHQDHFHVESLKIVLQNNPKAMVITNSRVRDLIKEANIEVNISVLEHEQQEIFAGLAVAGFGHEHAEIYKTIPRVMNTGYLIQERFFYPGDAFTAPGMPVEILAMPMAGPWMKISEAIDWVLKIKPRVVLPVHDGMLNPRQWIYRIPANVLGEAGIQFDALEPGEKRAY